MTFHMPDSWYDPPQVDDWEAQAYCDKCETDTDHYWVRQYSITYLTCEVCEHETELSDSDFED